MLLGFFSRVSTAVTGACALYFHGASNLANVDPHRVQQYLGHAEEVLGAPALDFKNFTEKFLIKYEPWGPHHHVTALTFLTCLLALTPCGGAISFDLWWSGRCAKPSTCLWALPLLKLHFSTIYFFSFLDKLDTRWLRGDRVEQVLLNSYFRSDLVDEIAAEPWSPWLWRAVTAAVLVMEGSAALVLFAPRTFARVLLVPLILLHAGMYVSLPVNTFSATMAVGFLLALEPESVRQAFALGAIGEDVGREDTLTEDNSSSSIGFETSSVRYALEYAYALTCFACNYGCSLAFYPCYALGAAGAGRGGRGSKKKSTAAYSVVSTFDPETSDLTPPSPRQSMEIGRTWLSIRGT